MMFSKFSFTRLLVIGGLVGLFPVTPSFAQQPAPRGPPCAERTHIAQQLRETFSEHAAGSGLAESGLLFELYVGPSGSWTLLATTPGGVSCLLGAGEAWEPLPTPDAFAGR